ncbi:MAG: hypoxanthine phosphoribosyltransferase [Beijerinckiaceae bacterium]|nr:hypoxanthine phosphoribosyltransferase [Beijerinckiaceae bacterium]MCZ8300751.1 hypoxanthine phosphoribosyltransferase [Beijerinckiaceae bacterium]
MHVLFDEAAISQRIEALAAEIRDAEPRELLVIAILRGSFIFAADLVRALHRVGMAPSVEFMQLASYHSGMASSGQVTIIKDIDNQVTDRDVLLIDDILESGRTLAFAKDLLSARGARRVMAAVLIEKPVPRAVQFKADFVGFEAPDKFLVGYGMDVAHKFRELPFVGMVEPRN